MFKISGYFDAVVVAFVVCWHIHTKDGTKGTSLPARQIWLVVDRAD